MKDKIPKINEIKRAKSSLYSHSVLFSKNLSERNAVACIEELDAMQAKLDDLQLLMSKAEVGAGDSYKSKSNGKNAGGFERKLTRLIVNGLKPAWLRSLKKEHKKITDSGALNQSITLHQMKIIEPDPKSESRTGYVWRPGTNYSLAISLLPKIEKFLYDREMRLTAIEIRRSSAGVPKRAKCGKYENEAIVAGIVYEFAGFLSARYNRPPSALAEAVGCWAEHKGMDLSDGSKIGNWEEFFLRDKKCNHGKQS